MGMLKEGVRLDRVRGGRQKYRRMMDNPYNSPHHMLVQQRTPPRTLEENKILHSLQSCEPETVLALPDSSLPAGKLKAVKTLSELYERQLVGIVDWAKQIPGKWKLYKYIQPVPSKL